MASDENENSTQNATQHERKLICAITIIPVLALEVCSPAGPKSDVTSGYLPYMAKT